jgi:hypothetical protein
VTRARTTLTLLLALALAVPVLAQRGGRGGGGFGTRGRQPGYGVNVPYDGRLIFTRIRYNGGMFGFNASAWNHDYPQADRNLPLILREITAIPTNVEHSLILDLEDPEIFMNPILYMWEPGFWQISDLGAKNLGDYLAKGGFMIFDDFEADQWINFEEQFARAVPGANWVKLDISHPVYHSFFDMTGIYIPHPTVNVTAAYYGVHEDNDPTKRLIAIANHNSDVAEYWEHSGTGWLAVDTTNDAYKLGANYYVYALTH